MYRSLEFGIFGLILVGLNATVTQAQRSEQPDGSIELLSLSCSSSGEGQLVSDDREDVSIGKQIFTPVFYFSSLYYEKNPTLLTCKLNPSEQPKTLQLTLGIQDYAMQAKHEITFNTYLDGRQTASHILSAGEGKTLLFDVTKTSNVALEAQCSFIESGSYCPYLYFLKASILPSPTSSLTNPNSTAFNNLENSERSVKPPLKQSSWGNSTVGEEETTNNSTSSSSNSSSGGNSNIEDTIEDVNTIINIFK
jgi:hypothetical protein